MARKYEMSKRAERIEETRRRIVEAAVELHATVGPARASLSSIAERAGVERQTYYRHFPDERSLFSACSGLWIERHPLPNADAWREVEGPGDRLRRGLGEVYAYFEANQEMLASVLRDAEVHPITREMVARDIGPATAEWRSVLATGWPRSRKTQAAIDLALNFYTWRSLAHESGLSANQAADLMAATVQCAA